MKPAPFEYCRADTLDEALDLLAEFGPDAAVLAGGLSLGALLNMRLARPAAVIDINGIDGLDRIELSGGMLRTGALVRQADALGDAAIAREVPLLAAALPHIGHDQTRDYGTFGGSVAHADPSAEIPLSLATLGGTVRLKSRDGAREVPARSFFLGMLTTDRRPDELVVALDWPRAGGRTGHGFAEFARRHGDFAIAAAAAMVTLDQSGRIAALSFGLGGVEDRPHIADGAAHIGAVPDPAAAREIAHQAAGALSPIADAQASPDYRRQLARVLGEQALCDAFARAQGGAGIGGTEAA